MIPVFVQRRPEPGRKVVVEPTASKTMTDIATIVNTWRPTKVLPDEAQSNAVMTEVPLPAMTDDAIRLWVIMEHDNKYQAYRG